jgi:hypothetical protein
VSRPPTKIRRRRVLAGGATLNHRINLKLQESASSIAVVGGEKAAFRRNHMGRGAQTRAQQAWKILGAGGCKIAVLQARETAAHLGWYIGCSRLKIRSRLATSPSGVAVDAG